MSYHALGESSPSGDGGRVRVVAQYDVEPSPVMVAIVLALVILALSRLGPVEDE